MKKFLLITFTAMLCFSICGCSSKNSSVEITDDNTVIINVDKAVESVDNFFEGLVDKVTN